MPAGAGRGSANKRIVVGADEAGAATERIVVELRRRGYDVDTVGALKPGDNPAWADVARRVAEEVAGGKASSGILFCWTGTGVSIAANKVPGVRAALCDDAETARGARRYNDANVLCLSLCRTSPAIAAEILEAWLGTEEMDPTEAANIARVREMDTERAGRHVGRDEDRSTT